MGLRLTETSEGVLLEVHVKPSSRTFQLILEDDKLTVMCHEAPVKGKVNRELVKGLSRLFNRRVELVSGLTSRQKRVLLRDIRAVEAERVLKSAARQR